jgi:hypothetical protein
MSATSLAWNPSTSRKTSTASWVLERSEHPVTVHLELAAVRLGQLSERVTVAAARPEDQVGCPTLSSHLPEPGRTSTLCRDRAHSELSGW